MNPDCLQYRLTDEERRQFETDGILMVRNALPPERVERLRRVVDRIDAERRPGLLGPEARHFIPDFLQLDDEFVDLLDWPTTFPKVWGIMGWNIYLYHHHFIVTPPEPPDPEAAKKRLGWHQDSGRVNAELESHPRPRLSLKIAYFLTDCTQPGVGNLSVIPGSHLMDRMEYPADGVTDPPGMMEVLAAPGDAVFFDRRTWHAGGRNTSDSTRKVLFYGYGYRWLRPKDQLTVSEGLLAASHPVRRQILGDAINNNGRFSPQEGDVPLRAWLQEHDPEAVAK